MAAIWQEVPADVGAIEDVENVCLQRCCPHTLRAPLSVGVYASSGESQQGAPYCVTLTLEVRDASGGQTPVDVDAQADWDEATETWVLTAFDCQAREAN